MPDRIPLVDYLSLEHRPHLVANECTSCGARYFDRRNACAACFGTEFAKVGIEPRGTVSSFTIVSFASPGIDVPFVAALVDCDGTSVAGNIVGVPPDPEHIELGMPVELMTFPIGTDSEGTQAVGFGFEPVKAAS